MESLLNASRVAAVAWGAAARHAMIQSLHRDAPVSALLSEAGAPDECCAG